VSFVCVVCLCDVLDCFSFSNLSLTQSGLSRSSFIPCGVFEYFSQSVMSEVYQYTRRYTIFISQCAAYSYLSVDTLHKKMATFSDLSDYERLRLENIKRNDDFLGSLGLHEVKIEIAAEVTAKKAAQIGTKRGIKRRAETVLPERRSSRVTDSKLLEEIKILEAGGKTEEASVKQAEYDAMREKKLQGSYQVVLEQMEEQMRDRLPPEPVSVYPAANSPEDSERWGASMWESFRESCTIKPTTAKAKAKVVDCEDYGKSIKGFSNSYCAKIVKERIITTMFHPIADKIICLAGDKEGCIGIWDLTSSQRSDSRSIDPSTANPAGVYMYYPHVRHVTSMHTWRSSLDKVYSTSYDGSVRCLDLSSESFLQIFSLEGDIYDQSISDATYLSDESSILLGMSDGNVSLVDSRSSVKAWEKQFQLSKINSIQQNPSDDNIIITAGSGKAGQICLHDLRMVGKPKFGHIQALDKHTASINAAYFTGDGDHIVSVSQDDYVFLWHDFIGTSAPSIYRMKHDNHTGRWLSTFKPSFDAKNRNSFILGSMDKPTRRMEVFEVNTKKHTLEKLAVLMGEALGSVQSRNCFHPSLNVLAGGNSSGKVSVFM